MNIKKAIVLAHNSLLVCIILLVIAYYFFTVRFSLPSDEEMIGNFQAHRRDIEELIRRYRTYKPPKNVSHSHWVDEGDTQEIMSSAGIKRITHSSYRPWLPKPYSLETEKSVASEIKNSKNYEIFYKYGGLIVSISPTLYYRSFNLKYSFVWKDLYFIPEVPLIENGELL
jgi:hypothetical protein